MKDVTIQLARVSQLEDTLTHFDCGSVNLIEEEHNWIFTRGLEPVWWVE
jgi:hypothetical protein